jgi:hypothetical protein
MERRNEPLIRTILNTLLTDLDFSIVTDSGEAVILHDGSLVGWSHEGSGIHWSMFSLWNAAPDNDLWTVYVELIADFTTRAPTPQVHVKIELIVRPEEETKRVLEIRTVETDEEWKSVVDEVLMPTIGITKYFE